MTTQIIPESRITLCDCCNCRCDKTLGYGRRVQEGRIDIKQHALDMLGSPAACGDISLELCDSCLNRITTAMNNEMRIIRSGE